MIVIIVKICVPGRSIDIIYIQYKSKVSGFTLLSPLRALLVDIYGVVGFSEMFDPTAWVKVLFPATVLTNNGNVDAVCLVPATSNAGVQLGQHDCIFYLRVRLHRRPGSVSAQGGLQHILQRRQSLLLQGTYYRAACIRGVELTTVRLVCVTCSGAAAEGSARSASVSLFAVVVLCCAVL